MLAISANCEETKALKLNGFMVVSHQVFTTALGTSDFLKMGIEEKLEELTEVKSDKGKGKKGHSAKIAATKKRRRRSRRLTPRRWPSALPRRQDWCVLGRWTRPRRLWTRKEAGGAGAFPGAEGNRQEPGHQGRWQIGHPGAHGSNTP